MKEDLQAEIYYLTAEEGGRKSSVATGYRGQFYYDGKNWDAPQAFLDKDICKPGESVIVNLSTLSPIYHYGKFYIGKEIETREGAKIVGKGKITKIYNQKFQNWSLDALSLFVLGLECYNLENIRGFQKDLIKHFLLINEIEEIKSDIKLNDERELLLINCVLNDKFRYGRDLLMNIFEVLENNLFSVNQKIKLVEVKGGIGFEIVFVTWDDSYLSGRITFSTCRRYK